MVARSEVAHGDLAVAVLEVEPEESGKHVDRLVLPLVELERQAPAGLDHDDLAA